MSIDEIIKGEVEYSQWQDRDDMCWAFCLAWASLSFVFLPWVVLAALILVITSLVLGAVDAPPCK